MVEPLVEILLEVVFWISGLLLYLLMVPVWGSMAIAKAIVFVLRGASPTTPRQAFDRAAADDDAGAQP